MLLVIRQSIHPSTGISKSKNPLSCPTSCAPFFKIYLWKNPVFCFGKPLLFFLVLQLSQIASRRVEVGHRYVTQYQLRVRMKGETMKVEISGRPIFRWRFWGQQIGVKKIDE